MLGWSMESSATPQSPPRMGIHSSNNTSPGNTNHCSTGDVLDKAVVVGERPASFQRANCATLVERLKRLQPLLDEVRDSRTLVSEPGFESVEGAVVKAHELLERCGPHASRVYMVS